MKKKKLWLAGAAVVLAAVGFLGFRAYSRFRAMKTAMESRSQVETVQVKKQNLVDSISVTGTVNSADSRDVSALAEKVEVLQVNNKVGDYVDKGDVIVVLDSASLELSLSEAQNSQSLSSYKENKSIESAAEDYNEAVEDGTDEYSKAVKNEAEAKENLQEADNDLGDAADRLKRREEALTEASDALAELAGDDPGYEEASKAVEEAQRSYTEAHQEYTAAEEADEKAMDAYEAASEALADAQKNNDRNIANAQDNLEQAQKEHEYSNSSTQQTIENYQDQIASCTVTAPISGIITAMNVDVGDTYMGEGNTLFSVADEKDFIVSASVDEYDINKIAKDMEAAVIVEALGEEELPATVSFVSPSAKSSEAGSASYEIEIALKDENTDLRIGMTAKASIVLDAVYDVLTVPYDCVETREDGKSVIYIDKDGERAPLDVELGMQGDYYVEVSGEGLDENTKVYYATAMLNTQDSGTDSDSSKPMILPGGGREGGGRPGGPGGF